MKGELKHGREKHGDVSTGEVPVTAKIPPWVKSIFQILQTTRAVDNQ